MGDIQKGNSIAEVKKEALKVIGLDQAKQAKMFDVKIKLWASHVLRYKDGCRYTKEEAAEKLGAISNVFLSPHHSKNKL